MHFSSYSTRIAAYAVIVDDTDRLLLTWWNGDGRADRAAWSLPGGGIEFSEQIEAGLIREIYEETGYHAKITGYLTSHCYIWKDMHEGKPVKAQRLVFTASITGGTLGTTEVGGSTDHAAWVPLAEIAERHPVSIVRIAVDAWNRSQTDTTK